MLDRGLPPRRVAVLVEAVAAGLSDAHVPRVTCLARSLTLCALLERRGERPALRFGVPRDDAQEPFEAHAWVELDGEVLNDTVDVRERFALLAPA